MRAKTTERISTMNVSRAILYFSGLGVEVDDFIDEVALGLEQAILEDDQSKRETMLDDVSRRAKEKLEQANLHLTVQDKEDYPKIVVLMKAIGKYVEDGGAEKFGNFYGYLTHVKK